VSLPVPEPDDSGPRHDLSRLIECLDRHSVDYVLAGGAAARAYGATRLTDDADCVVRRERANLDRLAAAMREMHARLRVAGMSDEEASLLPVPLDGEGFTIRAAALEDIIVAKEHADRPKDHEALPELRALGDANPSP
jgi:hypothetical protein